MRLLLFCAFMFYYIMSSSTRLIQKTTERPKSAESNEDVKDISNSEDMEGPEIVHFYKGKVRRPREGVKNVTRKNNTPQPKPKINLVKKPIPKYREMYTEEDYEMKMKPRLQSKLFDSFDIEDEDFSLDDYEFDVNHDEFSGGSGKPLVPRKEYNQPKLLDQKPKRNLVAGKEKNVTDQKTSIKVVRKVRYEVNKDILDDFPTKVHKFVTNNPIDENDNGDDSNDGSEGSNESPRYTRNERSPWSAPLIDKLGEKSAKKFLSFLPMFPRI